MTEHAILVVDDNPDYRELTVLALGQCCNLDQIATAPDGVVALQAIRANPGTRAMLVVMLSSSDVKTDIAACYASGANSYVRKSTNFDDLSRKLRQVYGFWLTVNERFRPSAV